MLEAAAFVCAGLLVVLTAVRVGLALRVWRSQPDTGRLDEDGEPVTVLQPILSGDPGLSRLLAENLANHPKARFLWLVDEDDAEGRHIAATLAASAGAHVEVLLAPPVPQGKNPKVFKLALGLTRCTDVLAVLDDDTVLPPGALSRARAALAEGDLVTGLPYYRPGHSLWSRLVAAFVNGGAVVTYLPMLAFGPPVTINGMFYLTRRRTLEGLGGFATIDARLCDDYELAKLFRRAGKRIVQTTIVHPLATTVPNLTSYTRLMRRWMVFAQYLFQESLTLPAMLLVVMPSLLPLASVGFAVGAGSSAAGLAALGAIGFKAAVLFALRRHAFGVREGLTTMWFEIAADLLQPVHALAAFVSPRDIRWRSRRIVTNDGGVHYR